MILNQHHLISNKPTKPDSPQDLSQLEKHLGGEQPITPQKASEMAPEKAIPKSPQHQSPNSQIPTNTCTDIIIHSDFKPSSPLQDILESSSPDQTIIDSSICSSEDLSFNVQSINAAQPLQETVDSLINKSSMLGHILEPVLDPKPILDESDNMDLSGSDEEEHINIFDKSETNLDQPSTSSQTIIPTPFESQTTNIQPLLPIC